MQTALTKAEVIDILAQHILIQEGRDAFIRDEILKKYDGKPYYDHEVLMNIYHDISLAYFKLGVEFADLLKS